MSLETMAFILGGIFIAAGLFGGGLEIKEIKLPRIAGTARLLAMAMGSLFILLALAINLQWISHTDARVAPAVSPLREQKFDNPLLDGMRLDVCIEWGIRCDNEAANAWCHTRGFTHAVDFSTENVGARGIPTRLLGSRQLCQAEYCGAFRHITCAR